MITQERLKEALEYDSKTGVFTWSVNRPLSHFKNHHGYLCWMGQRAGKEAGSVGNNGYLKISVFGKCFLVHRLAWLYFYGEFPDDQIDHINGNKEDNRIDNLRAVSCKENHKNKKISTRNRSGVMGVYWQKALDKWTAQISIDGKLTNLGSFDTIEEATRVRREAEIVYGYHVNHGRRS